MSRATFSHHYAIYIYCHRGWNEVTWKWREWKPSHYGMNINQREAEAGMGGAGWKVCNFLFLPFCGSSLLEPFWKGPTCQAALPTEGPFVLHCGSPRRGGQSGNPSPQRLCLLPSASPSPTVSLQLPTKTSALKPSPCLCCPDCSALPCDPRGAYHVEFTWRLGEVGLKCFENQASGFVKYRWNWGARARCPRFKPAL